MKIPFVPLAAVAFAIASTGCATHAAVNTPVIDVGGGAAVR